MSAATKLATTSKEPEGRRQHENVPSSLVPEQASDQESGLISRIFSGAPGEPSAEGAARLLGSSTFSHSANSGPRAISLKRAQQTHGNHFAQRVIEGIQRKPAAGLNLPKSQDETLIPTGSPGQPIDEQTRDFMESGFRTDFRDVLIHTDSRAAASAKAMGANAYTSGRDIYFAAGKYAPENDEGKRLLAHELVHTIQQQANTPSFVRKSASTSDLIIDPDDSLEQDADHVSARVIQGKMGSTPIAPAIPKTSLQREPDDQEPSGDEPLDPFVTGWTTVPSAVVVVRTADSLAIIPIQNAVYVPDPATAERFDPRVPKTPGTAPVIGIPAIGAGGTRIVPAGRRTAIIMDAGAGKGVSAGIYLTQFAGSLRSVGVSTPTELFILPIHGHGDHVNQIVSLITTYNIPPNRVLIPHGLETIGSMRAVIAALTTGASADTRLTGLGYGPSWKPKPFRDLGSGPEVIRLGFNAPGGVKIELVGLRSAIRAAQTAGGNVDLASYIARITHPDGTVTGVLGDPRFQELGLFRAAMEHERPGSFAEFFNGISRLSGFSHHAGGFKAGDVATAMEVLKATVLKTGKLDILEQTNLGQFGTTRRDTLELAARIGLIVSTGEQPTPASPTSGVVATGTRVTAHGTDARVRSTIPSQLTAGLERIVRLDLAERTIGDWRPVLDEMGQKAKVDELLREIQTSRTALQNSLSTATEAALTVRAGRSRLPGGPGLDYATGAAGAAYATALVAIPAATPAETSITPRGFEHLEYLRTLPLSDVPIRIALYRAVEYGEYSPQAFRAMLASLQSPARSLLTGPRGGPSPVGKAFERVRAQYFTETRVMPLPHSGSTAGFSRRGAMGARGVAGGLALLELFNQVGVPVVEEIKQSRATSKNQNLYAFARRIAFWAQMGARPSILGVEDPSFSWSPSYTRGFDEVVEGLHKGTWDAVVIESPGLSDTDVFVIGAFLALNVRNYDEYYELFRGSGQDAVRWIGSPWEQAIWEIRVGDFDTTLVNEVEDRWEKHDRLTELMQRLVPRWIANTEEHLKRFGRQEQLKEEDIARLGTFSHAAEWRPDKPLYQARLKNPVESMDVRKATNEYHWKAYIEHTVNWNTPPRFFVHSDNGKYALVSGTDFNTYATIRPLWTEHVRHALPYNTISRVANEDATCLIEKDLLERIAEPPPPKPVPKPPPRLWIEQRIYFPFRGAEPRSDVNYDFSIPLDEVARILKENPTVRVRVVGNTDNVGEVHKNETLSLSRAEAVKALLVARGISAERLFVEGAGLSAPIATNATEDGRARNRRVDFIVEGWPRP